MSQGAYFNQKNLLEGSDKLKKYTLCGYGVEHAQALKIIKLCIKIHKAHPKNTIDDIMNMKELVSMKNELEGKQCTQNKPTRN
jgi:hypothetical protein